MTTSLAVALTGSQRPRLSSVPPQVSSAGVEAVELAATAGLVLDEWQAWTLDQALGERLDGQWSAFEVALLVPRQQGKGCVLEARELAGLVLFGEQVITHTAHEVRTALEHFRRMKQLLESSDHLRRLVRHVREANGDEQIEMRNGARLRFQARSKGAGRGFSGDLVVFDEAYELDSRPIDALLPTMAARPNPQLWYASSEGNAASEQLRSVQERGRAGGDPDLCYLEWSCPSPPETDLDDRRRWAQANPALGIRVSEEFLGRMRVSLSDDGFAREHLGVDGVGSKVWVIDQGRWTAARDPESTAAAALRFAPDVSPDRASASIGAAARRPDGLWHVELVDRRSDRDPSWVVPELVRLQAEHRAGPVVVDAGSPAGSLVRPLREAGAAVDEYGVREYGRACGRIHDEVIGGRLRHLGQPDLDAALGGARRRTLGDSWAWARRDTSVDITPLVAVTLALDAAMEAPPPTRQRLTAADVAAHRAPDGPIAPWLRW